MISKLKSFSDDFIILIEFKFLLLRTSVRFEGRGINFIDYVFRRLQTCPAKDLFQTAVLGHR